jgi:hypothetical protein
MGESDGKIPLEYRDQRPERAEKNRKWLEEVIGFVIRAILELLLWAFVIFGIPALVLFCMKSCSNHP